MSPNHVIHLPTLKRGYLRNEIRKIILQDILENIDRKNQHLAELYRAERLGLPRPQYPPDGCGLSIEICSKTKYISIDISVFKKKPKKNAIECMILGCKGRGLRNNTFDGVLLCNRHRYRCTVANRYIRPQMNKSTGKTDTILIKYDNIGYCNALELKKNLGAIIHLKGQPPKHIPPWEYVINPRA